jgi:hypothetical protein
VGRKLLSESGDGKLKLGREVERILENRSEKKNGKGNVEVRVS